MNKRQAKKQYKKIHGYNPPKKTEDLEKTLATYNKTTKDWENLRNEIIKAFEQLKRTFQRFAENTVKAFREAEIENVKKAFEKAAAKNTPADPPAVVARRLTERRKRCRRREWRRQKR